MDIGGSIILPTRLLSAVMISALPSMRWIILISFPYEVLIPSEKASVAV